jgi:hypothetical protein
LYVALSADPEKRGFVGRISRLKNPQADDDREHQIIYVVQGYLLFVRNTTLMAQPFDTDKLETTGEALAVAEQVDVDNAGVGVAVGYFSASQNCVLVYTSGRSTLVVQLTWFDRAIKR